MLTFSVSRRISAVHLGSTQMGQGSRSLLSGLHTSLFYKSFIRLTRVSPAPTSLCFSSPVIPVWLKSGYISSFTHLFQLLHLLWENLVKSSPACSPTYRSDSPSDSDSQVRTHNSNLSQPFCTLVLCLTLISSLPGRYL